MILDRLNALVTMVGAVMPATIDPRDVNPPCAWIAARRMTTTVLCFDDPELVADIFLISPDAGTPEAHRKLSTLLESLIPHLQLNGVAVDAIELDAAVTLPTGGGPQPAYRVGVTF